MPVPAHPDLTSPAAITFLPESSARTEAAPFWPAPPRPATSADPAALAAIAHLLDGPHPLSAATAHRPATVPDVACAGLVRAGGRIVGVLLPFPADGEGPVYRPVRGPARIRELVDDGIIA